MALLAINRPNNIVTVLITSKQQKNRIRITKEFLIEIESV